MRWLIVTGGAHRRGGQDRANLEVIRFLSGRGLGEVDVVTHEVDREVLQLPGVRVALVPRPLGSIALGERLLEGAAHRVHSRRGRACVVLANGGNYSGADVNWVHSVHTVWPVRDDGAPLLRRVFHRVKKWDARVRERGALRTASLLVANSSKTARDLTSALGIPSEKVVTIPFGSDPWLPSKEKPGEGSRLAFIGALGWDRNKGLDIALEALSLLAKQGDVQTTLAVAGPGTMVPWRQMARRLGLEGRVSFLGMVDDVPALLRNVDLLVSPARYEAYGLAIQEALVAGVPALISGSAGIASSVEPAIPRLVVSDHEDPKAWAAAIQHASRDLRSLRSSVARLGASLAQRSWQDMAAELVREAEIRAPARRRFQGDGPDGFDDGF